MATIVKSPSKSWKAVIRRQGWPTVSKSSRTKLDPEDWARCTEDGIIRNVYVRRSPSEATTVSAALKRYLEEVTPSKRPSTQRSEAIRAKTLQQSLGRYSLAALTPDIVASFRDQRLGEGKSVSTVRLEVALLGRTPSQQKSGDWGSFTTQWPTFAGRHPGKDALAELAGRRLAVY
jgi:hypothetical protein